MMIDVLTRILKSVDADGWHVKVFSLQYAPSAFDKQQIGHLRSSQDAAAADSIVDASRRIANFIIKLRMIL